MFGTWIGWPHEFRRRESTCVGEEGRRPRCQSCVLSHYFIRKVSKPIVGDVDLANTIDLSESEEEEELEYFMENFEMGTNLEPG
jgi:hypothetical protein